VAPVAFGEDGDLAEDAVLELGGLVAAFGGLGLGVLALGLLVLCLLLGGFLAWGLALVAGVCHALLLGLLGVAQALLGLLALLLLTLLLLAVLGLLLLTALHGMKLGIKLIERLGEHLALELFEGGGEQGRGSLTGGGFGGFGCLGGVGLALLRHLRIGHGIGLHGLGLLSGLLQLIASLGHLLRGFFIAKALLMA